MRRFRSQWRCSVWLSSILVMATGTGCCFETVPVPACGEGDEPSLILNVVDRGRGELPILVAGRACGGSIDPGRLAAEYEVIIYAMTDRYYIQPWADDFRHGICESGYFETQSHEGDVIHAFLARAGLEIWPAQATSLPEVDGMDIIAEAVYDLAGGQPDPRPTPEPTPEEDSFFSLTTSVVGKGRVDPPSGEFRRGQAIILTAKADLGWRFVRWEGEALGTGAIAELTLDTDKSVIAVFDTDPLPFEPVVTAAPEFPEFPWKHRLLQDAEDVSEWSTLADAGALVAIAECPSIEGQGVRITYDLSSGAWVIARHDFPAPVDLRGHQMIHLSYRGSPNTSAHHVEVKFRDGDGDEFNCRIAQVAHVPAWASQYLDYRQFADQNADEGDGTFNWADVRTVLIAVVRREGNVSELVNQGSLCFGEITGADCTDREVPAGFEMLIGNPDVAMAAANWIASQQDGRTGFVKSWAQEPQPIGHIYDQAVALLVLMKTHRDVAHRLADALISAQRDDGSWQKVVNVATGERSGDYWVGDMAWAVYSLARYAAQFNDDAAARAAALKGADYLRWCLQPAEDGGQSVHDSVEANIDAWWAFQAVGYQVEADAVKAFLFGPAWDEIQGRWWRGRVDPGMALDCQTWAAPLAVVVAEPPRGLRALSFAAEALRTRDFLGTVEGLDGQGPFSVWYEGVAQYLCARGPGSQWLLDNVLNPPRRADGSMPGTPRLPDEAESWTGDGVWLTSWSGIAPTAWLYFANTESPFAIGPFVTP